MGTPKLNIKDPQIAHLARELTELTGETQMEAILKALRDRLERVKGEREVHTARDVEQKHLDFEKAWAEIQKIQEEIRNLGLVENMLTDNDLYDENGLPK
jgi:hypothetical protein